MTKSIGISIFFIFLLTIITMQDKDLLAQGTNHQQVLEPQGAASSMGKLSTVATDGPFDVLRNPAILTTQKEDNAVVIGFSREAYSSFDISTDVAIDMTAENGMVFTDTSFSSNFSRELSFNGGAAYTRKITEGICAGIAVTRNTETMQNKNTRMLTVTVPSPPNDLQLYSDSSEEEKNNTTNMVFSAGYKFLNSFSAGLQLKAEYLQNEKSGREQAYSPYENTTTKTKSTYETITPILGLGVLYKDIRQEAGLFITSGKYTWEKNNYELRYHDSNNSSNDYKINNEKTKKGKDIEGPGIIGGYYIQLNRLIGLALEAGCIFPIKYKEHNVKYLSEEKNYIETESNVDKKFAFMINGGVKLNPYKDMTVALGGGYRIIANDSTRTELFLLHQTSKEKSDIKFTGYLGTLGLENKILAGSKIIISMDLIYLKASSGGKVNTVKNYPNDDMVSMDMKMKQNISGFFFNTGAAYVQYF